MSIEGFCFLSMALAFSLLSFWLKSQGKPSSGSITIRSSASPGAMCFHWPSLISLVILGGEYISETMTLVDISLFAHFLRSLT